jgi:hypothetical protein
VLALLARRGPLSRAQIAERLELSPATITASTRRLLTEGLLVEEDPRPSAAGRPSIPLALVPESAHAIGIQVAGEHVSGVIARLDAQVVHGFRRDFDPAGPNAIACRFPESASRYQASSSRKPERCACRCAWAGPARRWPPGCVRRSACQCS